jgi:hypothetical protein
MSVKAITRLLIESVQVQDACNLSGVAHGLSRTISLLRAAVSESGGDDSTDSINSHPIVVLWVDKLASLAGIQSYNERAADAHAEAQRYLDAVLRPTKPVPPT